ncbi:hypothetical protein BJ875DRAFT_12267 [Amylocarpus encephaloides]|uniref:Uncharacterized protein n=1 Tax=Amylocarpus encephaloides TaxID=45428 RepID=A0A9P8C5C6_9HELO|nr:hypothetical protein BJ875DRAFT_12267 [Amylocarpus encephaloides]
MVPQTNIHVGSTLAEDNHDISEDNHDDALRPGTFHERVMKLLGTTSPPSGGIPAITSEPKLVDLSNATTVSFIPITSPNLATMPPSSMSELLKLESEYVQQMESLEVLPRRVQIRKTNDEIYSKQSEIYAFEQESAAALDGLPKLETEYATLKTKYDQDVQQLHAKEGTANSLISEAKSPRDRMKGRKAELEVAEMKPSILRQSIALDELDMEIQEKKGRSAVAEGKIDDLKSKVDDHRSILEAIEQQFNGFKPTFSERVPAHTEQSFGNIRSSLEIMVSMLLESLEKAELLLENVVEAEERKSNGLQFGQAANTSGKHESISTKKSRVALSQELAESQSKIEEMIPLYWVGHHTRAYRMEKLLCEKRGQKPELRFLTTAEAAANDANAKADATMDEDFEDQQEDYSAAFQSLYDIPVHHVWERRTFTMFIDIINWGSDMAIYQRSYGCDNFWPFYNKLVAAIFPDFKIDSNAALSKNEDLLNSYQILMTEHKAGREAYRARLQRLSAQGSRNGSKGNLLRFDEEGAMGNGEQAHPGPVQRRTSVSKSLTKLLGNGA